MCTAVYLRLGYRTNRGRNDAFPPRVRRVVGHNDDAKSFGECGGVSLQLCQRTEPSHIYVTTVIRARQRINTARFRRFYLSKTQRDYTPTFDLVHR